MTKTDFRDCPHCGVPLKVEATERVEATTALKILYNDAGLPERFLWTAELSLTESDDFWFACQTCHLRLPDAHQAFLHRLPDGQWIEETDGQPAL